MFYRIMNAVHTVLLSVAIVEELTHTSKMLTKIIWGRIEKKIDKNLTEDQFGF